MLCFSIFASKRFCIPRINKGHYDVEFCCILNCAEPGATMTEVAPKVADAVCACLSDNPVELDIEFDQSR